MTATQLRAQLVAAGLTIKEWPGWQTNGSTWKDGKPIGVMQHHTAPPVPFPVGRLAGEDQGRIKCNINTKPDGTVWLVAYRACNYSSGGGSGTVMNEVRNNTAPTGLAKTRGLKDTIDGNPYFWNFENDHQGDGRVLPAVQAAAILTATRVVNAHFGLKPNQTIAHAEWTERKIDPRWNGKNAHVTLNDMRALLAEDDMTPEQAKKLDEIHAALGSVTNETIRNTILLAPIGKSGKNLAQHLQDTRNIVIDIKASPIDPAAVAAQIAEALGPQVGGIVAAELKKLTLKAT